MDIRVIDFFGPICVDSDAGAKVCDRVHQALDRGETVCLDFSGVSALASAFLNAAVGGLYAFFGQEDLDRRLVWKGLDATDEAVMRFVQRNAIRFYSAKQPQQEALSRSSARAAEE